MARKNVEQGFWRGGIFHPIRSSDDYEPDTVGEKFQYKPKKKKAKKSTARSKRKNPITGPGGWIKAKAVRIVRRNGRPCLQIKK